MLKPQGRIKAMVAILLEPHSPASRSLYEDIQQIRQAHDPDYSTWLPHIPLISPFMLTSPIPKEHGKRWNDEGQVRSVYRLGRRMVQTPPLALESQDSILESEHFFRRGPQEYVPPLRTYLKHISARLRSLASTFPGGAFSLNLTTPDLFVTAPAYKFHLRPAPLPERALWDLNRPRGQEKTRQERMIAAAERQWRETGVYEPPPGLPRRNLLPRPVRPPDVPDYTRIRGEEGTRRLLLLQHSVHQALLGMGATLPPSPRNVYKPHMPIGQTTKTNPNERLMLGKLTDLLAPRPLSELDQPGGGLGAPSFPVVRMSLLVKHEHDPSQYWIFEEYPLARALDRNERLPRFASRAGKRASATDPDSPRWPKNLLVPVFQQPDLASSAPAPAAASGSTPPQPESSSTHTPSPEKQDLPPSPSPENSAPSPSPEKPAPSSSPEKSAEPPSPSFPVSSTPSTPQSTHQES